MATLSAHILASAALLLLTANLYTALAAPDQLLASQLGRKLAEDAGNSTKPPRKPSKIYVRWGQNRISIVNSEPNLTATCQQTPYDAIIIDAVLDYTSDHGLPGMNLAHHCTKRAFANSAPIPGNLVLLSCPSLAEQIQQCQGLGKKVIMTISPILTDLYSTAAGNASADIIWSTFLGGESSTRPFGNVQVDGINLEVRIPGAVGYGAFVQRLQEKFKVSGKQYMIGATPLCHFPDATMGPSGPQGGLPLDDPAHIDFINIDFQGSQCGWRNRDLFWPALVAWMNWLDASSPDKTKLFLQLPAWHNAGTIGNFIEPKDISDVMDRIDEMNNLGTFGGVTIMDASWDAYVRVCDAKMHYRDMWQTYLKGTPAEQQALSKTLSTMTISDTCPPEEVANPDPNPNPTDNNPKDTGKPTNPPGSNAPAGSATAAALHVFGLFAAAVGTLLVLAA